MTPLAWLVAFLLPACGAPGAQGLPVPSPLDFAHLARPASSNTALAAPHGFVPAPDIITPAYAVPAQRLYDVVRSVGAGQRRTYQAASYPNRWQLDWVVRSAVFNFPDLITAQVDPAGPGAATLVLYSRSVYGYGDLGANRRRVETWLAALNQALSTAKER